MKKKNQSVLYLLLLLAAIGALVFSTVSGAAAAADPGIESDDQTSILEMKKIGVGLQKKESDSEDFSDVSSTVYEGNGEWTESSFSDLFDSNTIVKPGLKIDTEFRVINTGKINEYVRVIITKYWVDDKGNKVYSSDEELNLIQLSLLSGDNTNWILDTETAEKSFLYFKNLIEPDKVSDVFMNSITIDGAIKNYYDVNEYEYIEDNVKYTKTVYDYKYNDKQFKIEIEVDAVQDHHAEDAIKSVWGKMATINDDGVITSLS